MSTTPPDPKRGLIKKARSVTLGAAVGGFIAYGLYPFLAPRIRLPISPTGAIMLGAAIGTAFNGLVNRVIDSTFFSEISRFVSIYHYGVHLFLLGWTIPAEERRRMWTSKIRRTFLPTDDPNAQLDPAAARAVEGEIARAKAEAAKAEAEAAIAKAETSRAVTEASKADAEAAKAKAETARAEAEASKARAEAAKATAESEKAKAQAEIEAARTEAEASKANAEARKAAAGAKRARSEAEIVEAEAAKGEAEARKVQAQAKKLASEAAKAEAEAKKADAETRIRMAEAARLKAQATIMALRATQPEAEGDRQSSVPNEDEASQSEEATGTPVERERSAKRKAEPA